MPVLTIGNFAPAWNAGLDVQRHGYKQSLMRYVLGIAILIATLAAAGRIGVKFARRKRWIGRDKRQ